MKRTVLYTKLRHFLAFILYIKAEYVQRAFTGLRDFPTHIPKRIALPRLPLTSYSFFFYLYARHALPLHPAALAFVSYGIVLVQVQVQVLTDYI